MPTRKKNADAAAAEQADVDRLILLDEEAFDDSELADAPEPGEPGEPEPVYDANGIAYDPENARVHTDRNKAMIRQSLEEVGGLRSIGMDGDNVVRAGNGVYEQAQALGMEIRIIDAAPNELIAVRRPDLRGKLAERAAIWDNAAGDSSYTNTEVLRQKMERDAGILEGIFDSDEWAALMARTDDAEVDPGPSAEDAEETPEPRIELAAELQKQWRTAPGQVWHIPSLNVAGRYHRVLCGDATKPESLDLLMEGQIARMSFTDPPWNVAIGKDANPIHRERAEELENDNLDPAAYAAFLTAFAEQLIRHLNGDVYCVLSSTEWPTLDFSMRAAKFHWSATIIWVKNRFVPGRANYQRRYEAIWYGWPKKTTSSWNGSRTEDDVWEVDRPSRSEAHPTMKPELLVKHAIENSSKPGDLVLDQFLGSGTTLVSAEAMSRICYGLEKAPKYLAVILQRASEMGMTPELVAGELAPEGAVFAEDADADAPVEEGLNAPV